jgi:hypothetical protein
MSAMVETAAQVSSAIATRSQIFLLIDISCFLLSLGFSFAAAGCLPEVLRYPIYGEHCGLSVDVL